MRTFAQQRGGKYSGELHMDLGEKKKHTHTALKSERHMKWTIRCMAH